MMSNHEGRIKTLECAVERLAMHTAVITESFIATASNFDEAIKKLLIERDELRAELAKYNNVIMAEAGKDNG